MRLVIADTGPINYLIQIGVIELLPRLFGRIVLPVAVRTELSNPAAPLTVRRWIADPPTWLEVAETRGFEMIAGLHLGQGAAIALALRLSADLVLMDDRKGVTAASQRGLRVTGTLGVLDLAAERGLVDFGEAIKRLEGTTFRKPEALLESLLRKHRGQL